MGISWPKEYGGRGAILTQSLVYEEELSRARTPRLLNGLGIALVGPTLMHWGTEEQKKRYIPKILSAEEIWCQGYSEPGSGSDVASLRTSAVEDGDYFLVNGQKVWTSDAHHADMCILLVRTDPSAPKHQGISYILVDMHSPGVTVRPLVQITSDSGFNEVFFEDVRVPKANLVGERNRGWQVAITTLMFERSGLSMKINTFAMEMLGPYSQIAFKAPTAIDGGKWSYRALAARALTIAGGTSEIQRNIIGERVLGLPKG